MIVIDKLAAAVCGGSAESLAPIVKSYEPSAVGVPVIAPVAATSASPGGRDEPPESDHEIGEVPPLTASWAAYAASTVPEGKLVVATVRTVPVSGADDLLEEQAVRARTIRQDKRANVVSRSRTDSAAGQRMHPPFRIWDLREAP